MLERLRGKGMYSIQDLAVNEADRALSLLWREVSDAAIFGDEKIIKAKYQAKITFSFNIADR